MGTDTTAREFVQIVNEYDAHQIRTFFFSGRCGVQYLKVWLFRWELLQLVMGLVIPVYQIVSSLGHVAIS